jgi:gas vesicle protein
MTFYPKNDSQSTNMLISLLAGFGAGIIVGLIIAPKSGQQLRAEIGDTVDDYLSSGGEKADEIQKSASNLAQKALRKVRNASGKAEQNIEDRHG